MMVTNLGTARPGEERLRIIRARAVERVCLMMVDPLHDEPDVQLVSRVALVGVHFGAPRDLPGM
jgi:hypothetical protein